ncbi:phage integrase SAM-like domain and Arm DNA-binding domain-containing protein [Bacteroides sp. 51]|uniref:phage integrase SAM-like domain and Arm DNA-binding domain-containing protein n=1 Tax=Bacteroides sp. 51 TaxID=2302938 RepID=UPI0013D83E28|nr:phage integrase SAM-like domain and Arm DNA-binding domain-containing protein [Bacteroides sp. 51]NDV83947.1 hypothetical protein [Bacteroides sp. 51]
MEQRMTFSVAFYIRRTRLNKHGEAPIQLRITINRMRADTTVKKTISPDLWNSARGKAIEKTPLAKGLNMYLDAIRARITHIHRDLEIDGERFITAQMVLDRYLGRDQSARHTILEVFREHNERCKKLSGIDISPATIERYETCFKHTQEFIRWRYKKDDYYLDELNRQFIEDYEFYFKTERGCSHNTTTKYLKNFKKITRIAINRELLKKDPFAEIKFSLDPVDRDFLESHEIQKMINQ